jgi:hypothetical protein
MASGTSEAEAQAQANLSALAHFDAFLEHRTHLTRAVLEAAPREGAPTLCILGAGNSFDVDLDVLANCYHSIHLVDIDGLALERTRARVAEPTRQRLVTHAPVDVSGMLDRVDRWRRFEVTPQELMTHPESTARALAQRLQAQFDVVLSACMLSQMQLSLLNVLTDTHRLFQAARQTLTLTHMRTLAALTRAGGNSLFVTDASAQVPHRSTVSSAPTGTEIDCPALLTQLTRSGRVFDFANPSLLAELWEDDPVLRSEFEAWGINDAWIWDNGPETRFLVYAACLRRRVSALGTR